MERIESWENTGFGRPTDYSLHPESSIFCWVTLGTNCWALVSSSIKWNHRYPFGSILMRTKKGQLCKAFSRVAKSLHINPPFSSQRGYWKRQYSHPWGGGIKIIKVPAIMGLFKNAEDRCPGQTLAQEPEELITVSPGRRNAHRFHFCCSTWISLLSGSRRITLLLPFRHN